MTPVGSIEISYLFIFYIKFDPTRKARLVADEHRHKDIPQHLIYSSFHQRRVSMWLLTCITCISKFLSSYIKEQDRKTCNYKLQGTGLRPNTAHFPRDKRSGRERRFTIKNEGCQPQYKQSNLQQSLGQKNVGSKFCFPSDAI